MKRVPTLLLIISLIATSVISCKKDSTPNNSNPVSGDSIYLDRIYDLYDNGSGIDTQNIWVCNYDNLKRLTDITSILHDDNNVTLNYYYYGNDSLPYKSMYTNDYASGGSDAQLVYHYYDANQQKIKDSVIDSDGTGSLAVEVINYTYGAGKMYGEISRTVLNPSSPTVISRDTATFDANNNILNNKDYILTGSNYILNRTSNFTYDGHPNPFSKLNISRSFNRFPNGETLFWEMLCHNNILTQQESTLPPNQYNFNLNFSYTYTTNGLPATSSAGSGADLEKEIYTYKIL